MSFFGSRCTYRPFSWSEALGCLAARYPTIHWYGDSNSRRDIRTLYTAGRWLDTTAYSCEDATDSVLAGTVGPVSGWPYPLPADRVVLAGDPQHGQFRLPAAPGEPLSDAHTTGSWLSFLFVAGLTGDHKMPRDIFTPDGAAAVDPRGNGSVRVDLVVLGLGSWEAMLGQWDLTAYDRWDEQRWHNNDFERLNVTRNLLAAAQLIHQLYVLPNPAVTIVLRTAPPMAERAGSAEGRHFQHQRIEAYKRRIVRVLRSSVIGSRLKVWDVQQLFSYKLHAQPSDDGAELCHNGHVGPVTIRTEVNLLFHALCPPS